MSHTSREPATKTWGPPRSFGPLDPASRVIFQLHNLTPGPHWLVPLEGELYSEHVLPPFPGFPLWRLTTPNFQYSVWHDPFRLETVVWYRPTTALVYYSRRWFATHQWNVNENYPWAQVYATDGTVTQSYTLV